MDDGIIREEKTSISNSTSIVGDIKAEEHLIINGTIKGKIEISNYNFFLGPSGRISPRRRIFQEKLKVKVFR